MGINRVFKRGKPRIEVRKRWPDGTTFRRFFPSMTKARQLDIRIEAAILDGTWRDLTQRLARKGQDGRFTVGEFSARFLAEIETRVKPNTLVRYTYSFQCINKRLGNVPFKNLSRETVYKWMHERAKDVAPATVNRDLTALKRMFGWAAEIGLIERHLLLGVRPFKEATRERRLLNLHEYSRLIESCARVKKTDTFLLTLFVVIIGETGCRKAEALALHRVNCDCQTETITLNRVKGYRARIVPMSPRLRMMLEVLPENGEFVLTNGATVKPLVDPKKGFARAAKLAGVPWLQIHDMRRFRACQWAIAGVPVPTIQKLLGHQSLETTLRYLKHLDPDFDQVRRASEAEMEFWSGRQVGDKPVLGGDKQEGNGRKLLN